MSAMIGVSAYKRLTARNIEGFAYLVNVKPDEQAVESPYPNTLRCILDNLERLAQYEDTGLSPAEVAELAKAKTQERKPKDEHEAKASCWNCRYHVMTSTERAELRKDPCDTCKDLSNWKPKEG